MCPVSVHLPPLMRLGDRCICPGCGEVAEVIGEPSDALRRRPHRITHKLGLVERLAAAERVAGS